ncbi:gustatory receptor [Tribolium castaneum]|uniref:Gustatory receptor n=1 Tax=Tribolium castaneum TaxID=7070 RepID=B8PUM5_TRICA|nr:gustatory receptor [Tribolium castaneum]ABY40596.1 gustatory receptor [Tribolium castaneum]EFA05780.1 gustatory receptor 70 [Tribolium castaneum]|eukprot:XP_008194515.1 PREDICTED: gustatory receptor [Tribolium castaneum]
MDHNLLRLIVTVGEFFAITPSKNKIVTKIYATCFIPVLMTASTVSVIYYRQPLYVNFSPIKLVVTIAMVLIVNLFNCYTVLAPVFCKRQQYGQLMAKLVENHHKPDFRTCGKFLAPNLIYWVVTIYVAYVWTDILGFNYYKEYFVEVVQLYFQFYYNYFLCVVVAIFWGKYRNVNFLLAEQLVHMQSRPFVDHDRFHAFIKRVEGLICSIKELNMIFNDVFGWPIIMIVLYSSLLLLNYLDDIFKNSFGYDNQQYLGVIISNISVVFLTTVGTTILILLCDSVLEEVKTTILLAYKIRQYAVSKEKKEIYEFINVVLNNSPQFTAAGFFSINKTTIFHMMGTVTTFFIIIIQFNTNMRV